MYLNEATPALRTIKARLYDSTGTPLLAGHLFAPGDLEIVQPDGTVANATNLPVTIANTAAGTFDIVVAQGELQQRGRIRLQLAAAGVTYWEWEENVDYSPLLTNDARLNNVDVAISTRASQASVTAAATVAEILDAIIEGPAQYDGLGELSADPTMNVKLAGALREMLAFCANNATGLNGDNPVLKSRVGGRNRVVLEMNNGNRTVTSRNDT